MRTNKFIMWGVVGRNGGVKSLHRSKWRAESAIWRGDETINRYIVFLNIAGTDVEKDLPQFRKAVQSVLDGKVDAVMMTINAFNEKEAHLFYKAMRYAHEKGVPVMLVPRSSPLKTP